EQVASKPQHVRCSSAERSGGNAGTIPTIAEERAQTFGDLPTPHPSTRQMNANLDQLKSILREAREEVAKVIIGQDAVINLSLITIFTRSHALVEGVPGVAKTLLVRTLAAVLGCEFARIQFTPDLMPSDITGTNIFNLQGNEFTLVKGPIF